MDPHQTVVAKLSTPKKNGSGWPLSYLTLKSNAAKLINHAFIACSIDYAPQFVDSSLRAMLISCGWIHCQSLDGPVLHMRLGEAGARWRLLHMKS
jgi:hypothetical protein